MFDFQVFSITSSPNKLLIIFSDSDVEPNFLYFDYWNEYSDSFNKKNYNYILNLSLASLFFSLIQDQNNRIVNVNNFQNLEEIRPHYIWGEKIDINNWLNNHLNNSSKIIDNRNLPNHHYIEVITFFECYALQMPKLYCKIGKREEHFWYYFNTDINVIWSLYIVKSYKDKSPIFIEFNPETYEILDVKEVE